MMVVLIVVVTLLNHVQDLNELYKQFNIFTKIVKGKGGMVMNRIISLIIIFVISFIVFGDDECCSKKSNTFAFSTFPNEIYLIEKEIDSMQKDPNRVLELQNNELKLCKQKAQEGKEEFLYYYFRTKSCIASTYRDLKEPDKAIELYNEIKKELFPHIDKVIDNDMPYLGEYIWIPFNYVTILWFDKGEKDKAREAMKEAKKEIDSLLIKYFSSTDYDLLLKEAEEGKSNISSARMKNIVGLAKSVTKHIETNMKAFEECDERAKKESEKTPETSSSSQSK